MPTSLGVNFGREFLLVGLKPWKNKAEKFAETFCHQNSLRNSPAIFLKFARPKQTIRPKFSSKTKWPAQKGAPRNHPEISSQKLADLECRFPYHSYERNRAPSRPFLGEGFWPLCCTANKSALQNLGLTILSAFPKGRSHFLREAKPGGFQTGGFPTFFGKGPDCVTDPFGTVPRRCC